MTRLSESEFDAITKRNPQLVVHETIIRKRIPVEVNRRTEEETLADRFYKAWRLLGGPELKKEHYFHPVRKWHFDFAHLPTKIAIEVNGGAWIQGRHNRGKGYLDDLIKLNNAQLLDWQVYQFGTGQFGPEHLEPVIRKIKEMSR